MHTSEFLVRKWVAKNISIKDVVLDVGARKFQYTKYQKCKMLYGVDLPSDTDGYLGWTPDSIRIISYYNNIFPVYGNCECLPFKTNSFDVIFINEVIEHIQNDIVAISELARVLKPTGKLLLKTPNGLFVKNTNPFHHRHYQPDQLNKLLLNCFKNVTLQTKVPNYSLNVKQFLPKNKFILKKAFFRYTYWIYFLFYGIWIKNKGSSIFATCKYPKDINKEIIVKNTNIQDGYDILACPICRGELLREGSYLKCNTCKIDYSYLNSIPFLIKKN